MRFYLYLEEKLLNLGAKQDLLTAMQARKRRFRQSLLLFLIPALLSPLLYYFLVAVGTVKPWWTGSSSASRLAPSWQASWPPPADQGQGTTQHLGFEPPAADSSL